MIQIFVNGISGRMGKALLEAVHKLPDIVVVGGRNREGFMLPSLKPASQNLAELFEQTSVVVDFSSPQGTVEILDACLKWKKPMVTGTTGLSSEQEEQVRRASAEIPLVQTSNFSVGINVLASVIKRAVQALGVGFDAEIVEIHHREKKDAPSGTAILLAGAISEASASAAKPLLSGRQGRNLARGNEIGLHSLRGGSVVGEHQVYFLGENENLIFFHQAVSRRVFTDGVIRALRWVLGKDPGYYTMRDVLDLAD